MNVISKRSLDRMIRHHPETASVLTAWYRVGRKAEWASLLDLRKAFPSADQVGNVVIFNILGGHYRLITRVSYEGKRLYVKALLTHTEYDRKEWLKWA